MKKTKTIVTHNAVQLAKALGMSAADGQHWEIRNKLVSKIIEAARKSGLTHAEIAKKVKTSRTRITAILNRNIDNVSTDLLLRILGSLGYRVTLSVLRQKLAA